MPSLLSGSFYFTQLRCKIAGHLQMSIMMLILADMQAEDQIVNSDELLFSYFSVVWVYVVTPHLHWLIVQMRVGWLVVLGLTAL